MGDVSSVASSAPSNADTLNFLSIYDDFTRRVIGGSHFSFNSGSGGAPGISTVSTAGPQSSFSGLLGVSNGKTALSFKEAMDTYFNNGGTATTVNDPVMRYDLASMGKHFKAVDEKAGVYMKDGVFFVKEKLGDHEVLQPVGITQNPDASLKMFGLSSGAVNEEQQKFFDRIQKLVAKMDPGERPELALRAIMEKLKSSEDVEKALTELEKEHLGTDDTNSSNESSSDKELELPDGGSRHK